MTYGFDAFVVRHDGVLDTIAGRSGSDAEGRSYRLSDAGTAWFDEGALRPATYQDFRAVSLGKGVRSSVVSTRGVVVEGPQGRSRGGGAHVFTPCCGAGHYTAELHGSVTCRGCGWCYRVRHFSAGTFWVSLGYGRRAARSRG